MERFGTLDFWAIDLEYFDVAFLYLGGGGGFELKLYETPAPSPHFE